MVSCFTATFLKLSADLVLSNQCGIWCIDKSDELKIKIYFDTVSFATLASLIAKLKPSEYVLNIVKILCR